MQQGSFITIPGNAAAPGGYHTVSQPHEQPQPHHFVYYTLPQGSPAAAAAAAAQLNSIGAPPTPPLPYPCGVAASGSGGGGPAQYPTGPRMPWELVPSLNASVNVNAAHAGSTITSSSSGGGGGADVCTPPSSAFTAASPVSAGATAAYASAPRDTGTARRISSPTPHQLDNNLPQLNSSHSGAAVGGGGGGGDGGSAASGSRGGHPHASFASSDFAPIVSPNQQPTAAQNRSAASNAGTAAPHAAPAPFRPPSYPASPPLSCALPPARSGLAPCGSGSGSSGGGGAAAPVTSPLVVVVPSAGGFSGGGPGSGPFSSPETSTAAASAAGGARGWSAPFLYPSLAMADAVQGRPVSGESPLRRTPASASGGVASAPPSAVPVTRASTSSSPSSHLPPPPPPPPQLFSPTTYMPFSLGHPAPAGYGVFSMTPPQQPQQPQPHAHATPPQPPPQPPQYPTTAAPTAYYVLATGQLAGAGGAPYTAFATTTTAPTMQPHLVQLPPPPPLQPATFMTTATAAPAHGFVFSTTAATTAPPQYTAALPHVLPVFHAPASLPPATPTGPVYDERVLERYRSIIAASTTAANAAAAAARASEKRLSASAKSKSGSISASATDTTNTDKFSGGGGEGGAAKGKAPAGGAATTAAVQGLPFDEDPVEIDTTKQQLIVNYLPQRLSNEQFKDLFRPYGELEEEKSHIIYDFRHRKVVLVAAAAAAAAATASTAAAAGNGSSSDAEGTGALSASSSAEMVHTTSHRASDGVGVSGLAEQPAFTTGSAVAAAACEPGVASDSTATAPAATSLRGVPRSKGYGFIYYKDGASTEAAIKELNGKEIDGKRIKVRYAEQQRQGDDDAAAAAVADGAEAEEVKTVAVDNADGGEVTGAAPARSSSSSCTNSSR